MSDNKAGHKKHLRTVSVFNACTCSCCGREIGQIFGPRLDAEQIGIYEADKPENADIMLVSGTVNETARPHIEKYAAAMPAHGIVLAVGSCACSGGVFSADGKDLTWKNADGFISGCPPRPETVFSAILAVASDTKKRA